MFQNNVYIVLFIDFVFDTEYFISNSINFKYRCFRNALLCFLILEHILYILLSYTYKLIVSTFLEIQFSCSLFQIRHTDEVLDCVEGIEYRVSIFSFSVIYII